MKGSQPEYRFVGTDSSFSVWFKKVKRGRISVRCGTTEHGELETAPLCKAVLAGVELINDKVNGVSTTDMTTSVNAKKPRVGIPDADYSLPPRRMLPTDVGPGAP